ncbi:MAG TPA: hypothetical protein VF260_00985 [Bacilli bacterium]
MLASFVFSYFFLFAALPALIIRFAPEDSTLDKFFMALTHSTLFYMAIVHLLVGIHLFEPIALYAATFLCAFLLRKWYARKKSLPFSVKFLAAMFDWADVPGRFQHELGKLLRNAAIIFTGLLGKAKRLVREHPLLIMAFAAVFAADIITRGTFSFTHLGFASSDSYVHLGWAKYLAHMKIYLDGVYPYGFEAIIAALGSMFGLDMYGIVRFMGPLTNALMAASLVYVLRKMIGKDYFTILLTVFLALFASAMMLDNPVILWRELSALSMEFAAMFLFPGIAFFYSYMQTKKRTYLVLSAECYAIAAFTHPFVVVVMTAAYVAVGIAHISKLAERRRVWRIIGCMAVAGLLGILPPIIGLALGKQFHGPSIRYFAAGFAAGDHASAISAIVRFARNQPLVAVLLLLFLLAFAGTMLRLLLQKNRRSPSSAWPPYVFAAMFALFLISLSIAPEIGLPAIVPSDRLPVFLAMSIALLFAATFAYFSSLLNHERIRVIARTSLGVILIIAVFAVPGQWMKLPSGEMRQYDEAVRGYLDINANYPKQLWDIISSVDELGMIYGNGYHTELWEFVRDLDDPDQKALVFSTPYVFLFVEKIPIASALHDVRPISRKDAKKPFPVARGQALTEFYYGSSENRRILMAKAYYWAEEYRKSHRDMTVFLETDKYIIYKITQGKNKVVLEKQRQAGIG